MQKFADSFEELLEGIRREARPSSRRRVSPSLSSGSGRYDASRLDGLGRGPLARLARRRRPDARPHVDELNAFAERAAEQFDDVVLLGMGGSSLAPEVLRRAFGVERSTSSTRRTRRRSARLEAELDLERTLFVVSSKSGSTLETRSHLDYFWERTGGRGAQFAAITDPGSELERVADERGFRAVFAGEPRSAAATRRSRCSGSCRRR